MERQLQGAKEAQEDRVRGEAGRADVLKSEVSRLRSMAMSLQADLEARKKAAAAELEAMQRWGEDGSSMTPRQWVGRMLWRVLSHPCCYLQEL